jgi:L-cysteate sulfo-lyase
MLELLGQAHDRGLKINHVVHAAGSGGTQAGLVLANKALGLGVEVLGICAEPGIKDALVRETVEIATRTAELLSLKVNVTPDDVILNQDYAGEAYEVPTSDAVSAIKLVAQTEGILLDPIYTGRAIAGLISLVKQGHFKRGSNVVFMHTGGTPTLFPYRNDFG